MTSPLDELADSHGMHALPTWSSDLHEFARDLHDFASELRGDELREIDALINATTAAAEAIDDLDSDLSSDPRL